MEEVIKPPDFSGWSTQRLQFLLKEYQASLGHLRALLGPKHPDTITHGQWIQAIEEELGTRG